MTHLLPPCSNACPVHTDVRGYLSAIAGRDYVRAYNLINAYNPFPSVCAWICLHPCEEACRRAQIDAPVAIRSLKRFAVEKAGALRDSSTAAVFTGRKVAIIGSGPSGLTAAHDLVRLGHSVTIYDRHREPGGHFMASLPLFRLPRDVLQRDVQRILASGINFVSETEVGKDISIDQLRNNFDAVIISTGLWGGRRVAKPGFDHPGVLLALPFLELANKGENSGMGKKVAVVGGGNVAMDVARAALRMGATEVTAISLENRNEMPASPWEIAEALAEGVALASGYGPVAVLTKADRITGIKLQRVKSVYDLAGRFNPTYETDQYETILADTIILSIGQTPETYFLQESSLQTDALGYLMLNKETLETDEPGVFAAGEIASGPGPAIAAVASGHLAANNVHRYLVGDEKASIPTELKHIDILPVAIAEKVSLQKRQIMSVLLPEERVKNFLPYQIGLDEASAQREARRCLSCGLGARVDSKKCVGCFTCLRVCPYTAPAMQEQASIAPENCLACGICAAFCPAGAITLGTLPEQFAAGENAAATKIKATDSKTVMVFICRNTYARLDIAALSDNPNLKEMVRFIEIPTSGALRLEWILTAFEQGAVSVAVFSCPAGQCIHPADSLSCQGVYRRAKELLGQLGIAPEHLYLGSPDTTDELMAALTNIIG